MFAAEQNTTGPSDTVPGIALKCMCIPNRSRSKKESFMNISLSPGPLVSLIAGILILVMPRLLNYIVAIYLIIIGLLGLFGTGNLHL